MLGKNKKIKEEYIKEFKFSNIISKQLLFSETHCDVYLIKLINEKTEYMMKEIFLDSINKEDDIRKEISLINKINNTVEKPKSFLKFHGYAMVEDSSTMEKSFYLIFDLIPDSLATIIKRKKASKFRLNFNEIYSTYRALLNSLTYLQLRNIRHRKINSQNIFCELEEEIYFNSIKLCDYKAFELKQNKSKFLFMKDLPESETKYISPEVEINDENDLYKVDVFALGILILEMGTYKFPTNLENQEGEFIDKNELEGEIEEMFNEMMKIYKEKIKPLEKKSLNF